jgi:hypothetical protein
MSIANQLFLQKTALDVEITYKNATIQQPISLVAGTGMDNIMELDKANILQYEITATGDVSVALLPIKVTGRVYLHPQSPALSAVQAVIDSYYKDFIIIPGVIKVTSKSGGWSYSFNNVVFDTPFLGYTIKKVVDDFVFEFNATPPNFDAVNQILNGAGGLVNLA